MNRQSLKRLENVMNLKKDTDAAALAETNRLLALAYVQKEKLLHEMKQTTDLSLNLGVWEQGRLEDWIIVMKKKLLHADYIIKKREQAHEKARQTLLRSNGEVKGVEHLLHQR